MAPKVDPGNSQGSGETEKEDQVRLPGAGMERVTCPKEGCGWFQCVTKEFPASEANRSVEIHMLGAHNLQLGGSMAQYAASVDATLALLREQSASPRPPPSARMEAAHRLTCK